MREETRNRIVEIARSVGFRPNDLAQSLHRGQSFTVGLISNDSFGRFTMPIMEGLEAVLAEHRIAVFMCNATDDPERERQHVEQLLSKRVDGLVYTARRADRRPSVDLGATGVPIVHVLARSDSPDAFSLLPDDKGGSKLATEHLIALGRKNLAYVTGPQSFEAVQLRRQGFVEAVVNAGLPLSENHYFSGAWSEKYGREIARKLYAETTNFPDGLVCGNDQIARGMAETLHDLKIDVPKQVSIVGFDNWNVITDAARPPLTSIDLNLQQLGRSAGESIMRMIAGEQLTGVRRLPCSLVVRDSCGSTNPQTPN